MRGFLSHHSDTIALLALAIVTIAVRAIWWGDPASDFDEQLYSLVGLHMLEGQWPYADLWDRKPVGLFLVYALAHAIGGPGPEAYQVLAGLAAFIAAVLTYLIAKRLTGVWTAFITTCLMLVMLSIYGGRSGQSEVFFIPLMLGMVWMLRDPRDSSFEERAYMAMLLGGFALQVKYTVLPQCIVLGLYALVQLWRKGLGIRVVVSRAIHFAVLGIVPTAAVFLMYLLMGHGDEWLFANVQSFFLRDAGEVGRFSVTAMSYGLACIMLILGGYYAAVRIIGPDDTETYRLVLIWAASCLATVLLPGTTYFYYYAALVPAAALSAIPLLDARGPGKWAAGVVLVLLAVIFLRPDIRYAEARDRADAINRMAEIIAPHVSKDGPCLWVHDGPTALYAKTSSCLPTPIIYPDHLNNALEAKALPVDPLAETASVLRSTPAVIVTADTPVSPRGQAVTDVVRTALDSGYEPLHQEVVHGRAISVWLKR